MTELNNKKVYFLSDFHLGVPALKTSEEREKSICRCLEFMSKDAHSIFLVGDVFDFWFDYKKVIPRGFIRIFAQLQSLRDKNIHVYFFKGNHDLWMFDYFQKELQIPIFSEAQTFEFNHKKFLIGHGDGLGPGDHGYKFIKKIFTSRLCQFAFRWIHPDIGISIAQFFSNKSRYSQDLIQDYLGPEKEWLVQYCEDKIKTEYFDYLIFGHRHLPIDYLLKNTKSRYINLGDWLSFQSYAVFDGENLQIQFFENENGKIYK